MDFEEARRLFDRIAPGEHLWKRHSHQVAEIARRLGQGLLESGDSRFDLSLAHNGALFHDLGRSKTHGSLHGWVGYVLLRKHGAERYGRGCIVHWVKGNSQETVLASHRRLTPNFVRGVYEQFDLPHLTMEDKVVSLADSLAMHDQVVTLDRRFEDIYRRYGKSEWMNGQYVFAKQYQEEIERKIGRSISELLAPIMNRESL